MKTIKLLLCGLVSLALFSCSGDKNSAKLEIKEELGDLTKFLSVDSDEAVISLSEGMDDGQSIVKLSCTIPVTVKTAVASNYSFRFDAEILDKNMNKICSFPDFEIESQSDYDNDGYSSVLKAGTYRAVSESTESKEKWENSYDSKQMWENIKKDGKYLVIKLSFSGVNFKEYSGSAFSSEDSEVVEASDDTTYSEAAEAGSSSSSEDWDKVLDEYENYVTKLAACAKKAASGDISVMTEYASLLESAESLNNKLENAKSDMTAAQVARLNKIVAKMSQSLM